MLVLVLMAAAAPGCASPYRSGRTQSAVGNQQAAIDAYTQAIVADPLHFPAHLFRGMAYMELGNFDAAHHDFSRAIGIAPRFGAAYYQRGHLLFLYERPGEALPDLERAIELVGSPAVDELGTVLRVDEGEAYYLQGLSLVELERYQPALESIERMFALKPDDPRAFRARGLARLGLGQRRAGCDDLSQSCGMGFESACRLLDERC